MGHPHLPTTEAAVAAVREVARAYDLEMTVTDDIGADQTSRRASAGAFAVLDAGGSLPHEAFVELGGTPVVTVQVFPEDDAKITVEGVEFNDIPRDSVPAFLRSVYGGTAHVKAKRFPALLLACRGAARGRDVQGAHRAHHAQPLARPQHARLRRGLTAGGLLDSAG